MRAILRAWYAKSASFASLRARLLPCCHDPSPIRLMRPLGPVRTLGPLGSTATDVLKSMMLSKEGETKRGGPGEV
jgi:hypothetical protein